MREAQKSDWDGEPSRSRIRVQWAGGPHREIIIIRGPPKASRHLPFDLRIGHEMSPVSC